MDLLTDTREGVSGVTVIRAGGSTGSALSAPTRLTALV
jgi:hypothetical protein